MRKIPSDEEFARADRLDKERSRNLDAVSKNVTEHFRDSCRLYKVFILPQRDVNFRAYVFFYRNTDVKECERSDSLRAIQDFILSELERQGRGKKEDITVAFEFDSDENVTANYEGDYFLRLR